MIPPAYTYIVSKYRFLVSVHDPTRAIYRLKFSSLLVGGFMPNEGHPNAKMHAHAALELASFIKEKVII